MGGVVVWIAATLAIAGVAIDAAHALDSTELFLTGGHLVVTALVIPILARQIPRNPTRG
jgi:hypothetical protein